MLVLFDFAEWQAQYPEFATVTEPQAIVLFAQACVYCDPTDESVVSDSATRKIMLYLLVAHLAALRSRAASGSGLVGAITSASQGSVSVGATVTATGTNEWYKQSQYGAMYWDMSRRFRSFVYVAGPVRDMEPLGIYGLFGNNG